MARQLRRKCTKVPVEQLAKLLDAYYRHGKPNSPESRQLALLLAMLPKEGQAVVQDTIKTVWGTETGFQPGLYQAVLGIDMECNANVICSPQHRFAQIGPSLNSHTKCVFQKKNLQKSWIKEPIR